MSVAVFQLPDATAFPIPLIVKEKMKKLAENFPEGLHMKSGRDTTPFISESITSGSRPCATP